jgi:hypothetical protein
MAEIIVNKKKVTLNKVLITFIVILVNYGSSFSQKEAYIGFNTGSPIWLNKGGEFSTRSYLGIITRGYFETKYQFEVGPFLNFNAYFIDEKKMYTSIDKNIELIDKSSANYSSYLIGPTIKFEKSKGRFGMFYGGSIGFNYNSKNSLETTFYPKDTIAAGYSYEDIGIYSAGFFSSYGYYIMPTIDFYYKIIDGSGESESNIIKLNIGFHCFYGDAKKYNTYNTLNNNQTEQTTLKYSERLSSFGIGFHVGIGLSLSD